MEILENQSSPSMEDFNELNNYVDELEKQVLALDELVDKLDTRLSMLIDYLMCDTSIADDTKALLSNI